MFLRSYLKHLGLSLLTYCVLLCILLLILLSKNSLHLLNESHLLRFDALLYQDIKNNGYNADWLCAFFPAFPYVWKLLGVSAPGMSLVNAAVFILTSGLLAAYYKMDWKRQLFLCTMPSLVFMFVPYTEALFFVAGTLLLIGLKEDKPGFILPGLLLASLVRPTTFVFIPAIMGAYFFASSNLKTAAAKSILPALALILGLMITITIHYGFTGKWFVFFEAQKLWKNYLHMPQLPFTSWGGDASTRLDGSALFVSLFCGGYILNALIQKLKLQLVFPKKDLAFSMLYVFGTALLILFYRDGNLYSLNRFIYATPFMFVLLNYFFVDYQFKWKHLWAVFLVSELFWLLFGSYNHIHNLLMYSSVSLYFMLLLLTKHPHKILSTISLLCLLCLNCTGIIKLACRFLNNGWVG